MLNRIFGNCLIEKDLMSKEQLKELLPVPKDTKATMGVTALVTKMLSPSEVEDIISESPDADEFGNTAVSKGLLTEDKLDTLLTYRSSNFIKFSQLLIDKQIITLGELATLIDESIQKVDFTEEQMKALILDDLEYCIDMFFPVESSELKELALTAVQTVRRLVDKDVYLEKAYTAKSIQLNSYACQAIIGQMHIKVYFAADGDELLSIANFFNNGSYDKLDEDALDNICEFLNCINGLFATNVSYDDIDIDINYPEASLEPITLNGNKIHVIPMNVNGDDVKFVLEVLD